MSSDDVYVLVEQDDGCYFVYHESASEQKEDDSTYQSVPWLCESLESAVDYVDSCYPAEYGIQIIRNKKR